MRNRPAPITAYGPSLFEDLLSECVTMAKYALVSGLKVPPGLMQTLDDLTNQQPISPGEGNGSEAPEGQENGNGAAPKDYSVRRLTQIYTTLADLLAPASPRTVLLLENESRKKGLWAFLGPVELIRRMMLLAIVFLIALIGFGTSPLVSTKHIAEGIFASSGIELLVNLLFILAAAGLGACFAGLFQANRFIANNTFDPKYESSYWIRIVLGLMAGIILAELIPLDLLTGGGDGGSDSGTSSLAAFGKPVLALLGGFSAAAVYRIIARIVDALESLVRGDTKDAMAAQGQVNKAQYQSQLNENRLNLAAKLTRIQQKMGESTDPNEIKQELDKVLSGLIPQDTFEEQQQ